MMKEDLDRKEGAVPPGIEIPGIPARKLVNAAIDQLRLALETKDTGERIRLLNGALQNTGNAIGQLALFESDGSRRPERR